MPSARDLLKVVRAARVGPPRLPTRLAVFAVLALWATYPLLATAPALNEFRDAHVLGHYETVARDAILRKIAVPAVFATLYDGETPLALSIGAVAGR